MVRPCQLVSTLVLMTRGRAIHDVRNVPRDDVACGEDTAEHISQPFCAQSINDFPPASLLQKVFRHEFRSADASQTDNCTGVLAQERCWHLSELGESCSATCAKMGRLFSYKAPDVEKPITPEIVGHDPIRRQEPWLAFECYVPEEDRYHLANANAAKHQDNDAAFFESDECMLACPCGELGVISTTTRPASTPHHADVHADAREAPKPKASNATPTVPLLENATLANATAMAGDCDWVPAPTCVAEFDYEGTRYGGCTVADHVTPWCSTSDPYVRSWRHCTYTCMDDTPQDTIAEVNKIAMKENMLCTWKQPAKCARPFVHKGVNYTGCADVGYPTPWCSHDPVHMGNWSTCDWVCTSAPNTSVANASVPTTSSIEPAGNTTDNATGGACVRDPDPEKDKIGQLATLDEAGYKIAKTADCLVNMKRFVCRVIDKLNCRVVSSKSLMEFIPSYTGLVVKQNYTHLEAELNTICTAGGTWLIFDRPAGAPKPTANE